MAKLYKSRAWLQRQRDKGLTAGQIAAVCGVSQQMISKQLKEFGMK